MTNPTFLISLDISVDPNYGFVKALRTINSCKPRKLVSDSISMFIHVDFESPPTEVIKCVEGIEGVASIDVKLCLRMSEDLKEVRSKLRDVGFTLVPIPLAQRIIAYRKIGEDLHVVIERTSRPGIYMARVARCRTLPLPPPQSVFLISGRLRDVVSEAQKVASVLGKVFSELSSKGFASPCT